MRKKLERSNFKNKTIFPKISGNKIKLKEMKQNF
jgi:hypothetical protein